MDPEPKAGLSVTGEVDAARAWSHRGARAGQVLVLTKAIGTGVIVQAMKSESAPQEAAEAAIASMRALNDLAREAGARAGATSATDVTGFGLLGHLKNMCDASQVTATLSAGAVPLLPGARALAEAGVVPGGSKRNLGWVQAAVGFDDAVDATTRLLLADAQTSGGLLLTVPEEAAGDLVSVLRDSNAACAIIGSIGAREGRSIVVKP